MRLVKRAENWERAYEAFQQVNFAAWDYITIKESMLDFLKLYYPEDFNDFIETGELITLIETFAYLGEQMAYRLDMNAHESFMTVAQRKEAVLRHAKGLSYNASRNIPARGLVKINTISTSERLFDSAGNDLSNKSVRWNDPINTNWKEQFILVLNRVLAQNIGSVLPSDRVQVQDVLFEVYDIKHDPIDRNVLKYNTSVSGDSYQMELVPVRLNDGGPYEKRPEKGNQLNIMYLTDGLGDSSETTGFFLFTKQGELQRKLIDFDGLTPNQRYDVNVDNCNDTDVWVNNINPITGAVIESEEIGAAVRAGEWGRVDVANAQNVIFNTNPNRNKYEVETLPNDKFRLLFGDGKFADIPSGRFEIWFRVSANKDFVIPTTAIQNVSNSVPYKDSSNRGQTFSFSFSLVDPIQNAAPSEDIERIRRTARSVYYTQDRMVNGKDYNEFMLQDNTILKLRSINRTFAGESKYISWHDSSEYYDNVKIFGNDLTVYFKSVRATTHINYANLPPKDSGVNTDLRNAVFLNYIQPALTTENWFVSAILKGITPTSIRQTFTTTETTAIKSALTVAINSIPRTFYLVFNTTTDVWTVNDSGSEPSSWDMSITVNSDESWDITVFGHRVVAHSDGVKFTVTNDNRNVITSDTLKVKRDEIIILKANTNATATALLTRNYKLNVMAQEIIENGIYAGLESIHDLHIIPADEDGDGIPDNSDLAYLIGNTNYVYLKRESLETDDLVIVPATTENLEEYNAWAVSGLPVWKWVRERGVYGVNFLWMHRTPRYHLVDPSPTNIVDMYVIQRGYYALVRAWLKGNLERQPAAPSPLQLRNDYSYLLQNKMISDTVVLHPGKIKVIMGELAHDVLRATIKVIRAPSSNLTNNHIKTRIVDLVTEYFDISRWEFGETFYFTELSAFIHSKMPVDLDSVVIVPKYENHIFGDLYQIFAKEDEIIQANVTVSDVEIVESLNPRVLKQSV